MTSRTNDRWNWWPLMCYASRRTTSHTTWTMIFRKTGISWLCTVGASGGGGCSVAVDGTKR